MAQIAYSFDGNSDNIEVTFREKLTEFCKFATQFGYNITPYREETWIKFRTLGVLVQKSCFDSFLSYYNVCMQAAASGIAFNDDRSLTWWAMKEYGLRPCSDFFDKLSKDDVLEIYNKDGLQIYRNWAFFGVSGYSMGDLFVFPWNELYVRDQEITDSIFAHVSMALSPDCRTTFPCTTKRHVMIESISPNRNVCDVSFKYLSPLFDSNEQPAAFVITANAMKIGKDATINDVDTSSLKLI